jgi:hypothetical protein
VDKKYINLLVDVKKLTDTAECSVLEQNMEKLKKNYEEQSGIELGKMEKERNLPLEEKKN